MVWLYRSFAGRGSQADRWTLVPAAASPGSDAYEPTGSNLKYPSGGGGTPSDSCPLAGRATCRATAVLTPMSTSARIAGNPRRHRPEAQVRCMPTLQPTGPDQAVASAPTRPIAVASPAAGPAAPPRAARLVPFPGR